MIYIDQHILLSQQSCEVGSVITPIYMWGNGWIERLRILAKVIELVNAQQ